MKIYKVLIVGRDCMKHPDGFLREGDFIHSYGMMMIKVASPTTPYRTTSMFVSEVLDSEKWKNESWYREATLKEIEKLIPHLTTGKGFSGMLDIKEKIKQSLKFEKEVRKIKFDLKISLTDRFDISSDQVESSNELPRIVPLYVNFDNKKYIGTVFVTMEENKVIGYVNIENKDNFKEISQKLIFGVGGVVKMRQGSMITDFYLNEVSLILNKVKEDEKS